MAAQRAVTEAARAWHAKLAAEFAARLTDYPTAACIGGCYPGRRHRLILPRLQDLRTQGAWKTERDSSNHVS